MAKRLGAKIVQVEPGYLSVVQARAEAYCKLVGATLAPFGVDFPAAIGAIAAAASALRVEPAEVWCAAGSGVLARALAAAWPQARRHVIEVGRSLMPSEVAGARIHLAGQPFGAIAKVQTPFPSDLHYDAKAWGIAKQKARRGAGLVVFWNVTGPAS